MSVVTFYTTVGFPACDAVRALLKEYRVPFREIDVNQDPEAWRDLIRRTGQSGVPVTLVGELAIVGWDRAALEPALKDFRR